jgi:hypothetical protein
MVIVWLTMVHKREGACSHQTLLRDGNKSREFIRVANRSTLKVISDAVAGDACLYKRLFLAKL